MGLREGFRDEHAEDDAAVGCLAGDDLKDGAGADLDVDVAGAAGGDCEVARHEVEAAVAAFVEDDLPFAVEDEDVFGSEVFRQPIAEDLHAFEETAARGWLGWGWVLSGGLWFWRGWVWICGLKNFFLCWCARSGWLSGLWLRGLVGVFLARCIGKTYEGFIKSKVVGGETCLGDGAQELLGEVPDFSGVYPWIERIH